LLVGSTWDTFTGICLSLFIRRKKGILWTEGNTKTPGQLNGALGWFKRLILRQFEYAAVPGLEGKEYVRLHQHRTPHRMPDTVMLPNLIDERRFRIRAMWSPQEIVNMRNRLAVLKTEHIALTPARLEPAKGLVEFIEKMPDRTLDGWKWVIIGEGSQKQRLEEVIQKRGMGDRVMILKYVPYEEMPLLYAVSDLFILPSVSDPNPLAVIEAMHSGLPLLLSKQVGNFHEALLAGKTGWGFSPFDTREVHLAIKQAFSASSEGLKDYGKAAKIQAEKVWSSERAIKKFVESIGIPVDTEKRGKRVNAFIKNILDLQSD
jgi:glycosyltransferase involved in cell wall biosynthesis